MKILLGPHKLGHVAPVSTSTFYKYFKLNRMMLPMSVFRFLIVVSLMLYIKEWLSF